AVLWDRGQRLQYLPARAVNQAAASYRGEGKTDARDAHVIADQARMRRDLPVLRPHADLVAKLPLRVAHRPDLRGDRPRPLNRLRQHLTAVCPALERAAEPASQGGWLVLLARYQRAGGRPRARGGGRPPRGGGPPERAAGRPGGAGRHGPAAGRGRRGRGQDPEPAAGWRGGGGRAGGGPRPAGDRPRGGGRPPR